MTVITLKDTDPIEAHLGSLKTWKRDAKKFKQTATYDLASDSINIINKLRKENEALRKGAPAVGNFTRTPADLAFSNYIRARAGYRCQRCGTQYPPKSNGLQCSHNFSRRYYNIRFHPDNALALCHNCHNYWFSKDITKAARFLEETVGKNKLAELERLKKQPDATKRPPQSELDAIAEHYQQLIKTIQAA
ncbi:HNH endonuclease [Kingella oralis]|jgi:bacteriophage lambda ninG protein|uniref:Bacteriophage Lambda NinG protein n=1 Tax=Kingella oralis ATCC 51147 TaxID=629741 RepID=C4GFR3_9NEIS|nr:HNH endonuclease [Kingella oralis]EEP69068.1 hypothetical protein GCWU000324_00980 [Kingella oralis ATCC 51147]QMT41807.1 HNH endonuclease [Kingella oralis]